MVTEDLPPVSDCQPGAPLVYLDQWVWVNLAKAASADEGGVYADLLDRLRRLRSSGRIVLPLAAGNYLELLHRRSSKSRREVAKIMAGLSGYATLRAIHLVQAEEVRLAAIWVRDPSAPPPAIDRSFILGTGANHAFGSRWGRWRFVETFQPDGPDDGPETEPPEDFRTLATRLPVELREWLNLVGADEDYNLTVIDYRPGHRLGDEFRQTPRSHPTVRE